MRLKRISKIFLIAFLFLPYSSKASHILGGEITWSCLPNGRFIFEMTVYRDCQGINFVFQQESITVSGNSLPLNSNNQTINSLVLNPDLGRFNAQNNGDLSPECYASGWSCASGDETIQAFYYRSNPIQLNGVPPNTGWQFSYQTVCCRPNLDNFNGQNTVLISTMYPIALNQNTILCADNAPHFAEPAFSISCRNKNQVFSNFAIDAEGDSLVYEWAIPMEGTVNLPIPLTAINGYSFQNPLPDSAIDSNNVAAQLDSETGLIRYKVSSGAGSLNYQHAIEVKAYRKGNLIASIRRDFPIIILDCALPAAINNEPPKFNINSQYFVDTTLYVEAGDTLAFPLQIVDTDLNLNTNPPFQKLKIVPLSSQLDQSYNNICAVPNYCPAFQQTALVNQAFGRYEYQVTFDTLLTFYWSTTQAQLTDSIRERAYYFLVKASDDNCSIPATEYAKIKVVLLPKTTGIEENGKEENQISIYPNPGNGLIQFESVNEEINSVVVRDLKGSLVYQKQRILTKSARLNLGLEAGIYFVEFQLESGLQVVKKLIIQ